MLRLFIGDDRVGIEEAVAAITAGLNPAVAAPNLTRFDGATVDLQELAMAGRSLPFLGSLRVVVVDRLGERMKAAGRDAAAGLLEALRQMPPTTELVVVEPEWAKQPETHPLFAAAREGGEVRSFTLSGQGDALVWIGRQATALGVAISRDAAAELHRRVGDDSLRLRSELEKLGAYAMDDEGIEAQHVRELVTASTESSVFDLVDAIGRKQAARALGLLQDLLRQAEPAPVLLVMIGRQFRLLTMVKDLLAARAGPGEIGGEIGAPAWLVRRLAEQSRHFTLPELEQALARLVEADYAIKGGSDGSEEGVLIQLVAELTAGGF